MAPRPHRADSAGPLRLVRRQSKWSRKAKAAITQSGENSQQTISTLIQKQLGSTSNLIGERVQNTNRRACCPSLALYGNLLRNSPKVLVVIGLGCLPATMLIGSLTGNSRSGLFTDRPDHLALSHRRKAWHWPHGRSLQSRRHSTASRCRP